MNLHSVQAMAGITSSMIFISGNLPMLYKAIKTKDMHSYSLGQLVLGNVGNLIYWLYVRSLPVGPVWYLQGFFTTASALMLFSYLHYEKKWFHFKRRSPRPHLSANPGMTNHPCGPVRNRLDDDLR